MIHRIVFFVALFFLCNVFSGGYGKEHAFIQYGYGKLNGARYPFIYLLSGKENSIRYKTSYYENRKEQDKHGIYAKLSIERVNHQMVATVIFNNISKRNYLVHRNRLSLNNDVIKVNSNYYHRMCGGAFLIVTRNVRLDYIGSRCEFDENIFENDWITVPARQQVSFKFILNDFYVFFPGDNNYNIGSLEYYITNEEWVLVKKIYHSLFDMIEYEYQSCATLYFNKAYLYKGGGDSCESDISKDNVRYFIANLNLNGGLDEMYFQIRSNQVEVNVDGDEIESIYDE